MDDQQVFEDVCAALDGADVDVAIRCLGAALETVLRKQVVRDYHAETVERFTAAVRKRMHIAAH